ncbi:hypothetical protein FRC17_000224 [Serendipita sp. 399]|nr:hypothetical protein FRC17_000224 [Serendipita sp. 399]
MSIVVVGSGSSHVPQVGHYKFTANVVDMSVVGTVIVVVLILGVLSFLIIPALMGWHTQRRFIRRFEGLVREDRVRPVLVRNDSEDDDKCPTRFGRKVTLASLWEAWVVDKAKDQEPTGDSFSDWKPVAVLYLERPQESCLKDAILATKDQKKQAKKNVIAMRASARERSNGALSPPRNPRLASGADAKQKEKMDSTNLGPNIDSGQPNVSTRTAPGKIRLCTLILMPSISRRRYHGSFKGLSRRNGDDVVDAIAENGALSPAVRPVSPSSNRDTLNTAALMDHGESSEIRRYHRHRATEHPNPLDRPPSASSSDKDRSLSISELPPIEIGVAEQNLDQASEILESIERARYERARESLVSLEDEQRILSPMGTRQQLYPIMYGARPLAVPIRSTRRQVLLGNSRIGLY